MVILTQNHRMFVDTATGNLTQFFITPKNCTYNVQREDKSEFWVCAADMKMTDETVTLLASYSTMSYATLNLEALYRAYALGTRSYEMLPDYKKTAPKTKETADKTAKTEEVTPITEEQAGSEENVTYTVPVAAEAEDEKSA